MASGSRLAVRALRAAALIQARVVAPAGRRFAASAAAAVSSATPSTSSAIPALAWILPAAALAAAAGGGGALAAADTHQRTFIAIKPDGVNRGLVADIIARFERKGYKLVGIKVIVPPRELVEQHYAEHKARPFYGGLVDFLASGPVVAMVWEGAGVVKYGRTMIGATSPLASPPGTIRGDFAIDVGRNIIHGSDGEDAAAEEIALWFKPDELADYELDCKKWIYE
eukprot:jgi/Chlat1/8487/Chrsp80S07885